jgi:hypothetical protein
LHLRNRRIKQKKEKTDEYHQWKPSLIGAAAISNACFCKSKIQNQHSSIGIQTTAPNASNGLRTPFPFPIFAAYA